MPQLALATPYQTKRLHRPGEYSRRTAAVVGAIGESRHSYGRYVRAMSAISLYRLSDAFSELWSEFAEEFSLPLQRVDDLSVWSRSSGVALLAAGGEEGAVPQLLRQINATANEVAVVGAESNHRIAAACVRAGAAEYFALPTDLELLRSWIREQVDRRHNRENRSKFAANERAKYAFDGIFGSSPALRAALGMAERVIPHAQVTVLITGETGTGKELLARAIHYQGPRREGPFVDINCAAIPEQLLESELFGHEKGAFTGATSSKPGLFEVAAGGTLFLDEIGHLALSLQGKLLRALEERTIRRVGGQRLIRTDVRVIAATHVDLERAAKAQEFRADLYHRLNVIPLELPALRKRPEDLLPLARHFLAKLAADYKVKAPTLTNGAERALAQYDWPGNIRELRNAMERALLLAIDHTLTEEDFAFLGGSATNGVADGVLPFPGPLGALVKAAAQEMIVLCGGNKSEAARRLGISRPRLQRLTTHDDPLGDHDA